MSVDPETLLAKYQSDFAAYDDFLQRDAQTPRNSSQRPSLPTKQQQQPQKPYVDPNETILEMNTDDTGGEDDELTETEEGRGDDQRTATGRLTHDKSDGPSTSPAARPPVPRATSATSAAAVARAIAAHGGLDGPTYDPSSLAGSHPQRDGSRTPGQSSTSAPHAQHSHGGTATARRRASAGPLDEVDQYIEERLQSAGRYRSSAPPDAMYIKSQAWALRRRQINEALRQEQEDMAMHSCTFQPQLGPAAEAETESNFIPPVEDEGPYAAAGLTVTEDPGVAQHLARLEAARQRRREVQARLDGGGAAHTRWTGRATVPRAFELGGRVAEPIPSLRKPCVPAAGETAPWLAGGHHTTTTNTASKPESKPRVAFGTVLSGDTRAQKGKRGSGSGVAGKRRPTEHSIPQTEGHPPLISERQQQQQQQQQRQRGEENRALSTTDYDPDVDLDPAFADVMTGSEGAAQGSHDLVRRLSDQLAHKDAIIEGQTEELERLHRELEAVKETLQQIASLGTVR